MGLEQHRHIRVPDIETARRRILMRREEQQKHLIQDALAQGYFRNRQVVAGVKEIYGVPEKNIVIVKSELFKVLAEFVKSGVYPDNEINQEQIALGINDRIGHLLDQEWSLNSFYIPPLRTLNNLGLDPRYDLESLRTLSLDTKFRRDYNKLVFKSFPNLKIKDMPTTIGRNMSAVFRRTAFTPKPARI